MFVLGVFGLWGVGVVSRPESEPSRNRTSASRSHDNASILNAKVQILLTLSIDGRRWRLIGGPLIHTRTDPNLPHIDGHRPSGSAEE